MAGKEELFLYNDDINGNKIVLLYNDDEDEEEEENEAQEVYNILMFK